MRAAASRLQPGATGGGDRDPGVVLSGAMDGHLRAFSSADGTLLWDVDTAQGYDTVNGVQGRGGSLDGAGPVVAGGMVFVNSGYPRFGGMPGNVLLAFALPDRAEVAGAALDGPGPAKASSRSSRRRPRRRRRRTRRPGPA